MFFPEKDDCKYQVHRSSPIVYVHNGVHEMGSRGMLEKSERGVSIFDRPNMMISSEELYSLDYNLVRLDIRVKFQVPGA